MKFFDFYDNIDLKVLNNLKHEIKKSLKNFSKRY